MRITTHQNAVVIFVHAHMAHAGLVGVFVEEPPRLEVGFHRLRQPSPPRGGVVEDRGGQLSGSSQIPHSSFLIITDTTDFFVCGKPHRGIPIQAGASAAQPLLPKPTEHNPERASQKNSQRYLRFPHLRQGFIPVVITIFPYLSHTTGACYTLRKDESKRTD